MQRVRALALCTLSLLASACVVGPNYKRPTLDTAASLGADAVSPPGALAPTPGRPELVSGMDVPPDWWRVFQSPALNDLVTRALRNSPTVAAARATLRAAEEQVKAQHGAYYPTVSASFQPSRSQFAETLSSPTNNNTNPYNLTTSQVSVAYTPDIFGANARAVESLVAQADQQRFELAAARVTLITNLVQAAVQEALLRAEIAETQAIIQDQQRTLTSFQAQFRLGQISRADLASQEALTAQTQANLPPLVKAFRINRDLIAELVGQTPGEPLQVAFDFDALALPTRLPLSLPAALVQQRPDVRLADAVLHAASAEIGVATAARLPNLQIQADGGTAALTLAPTVDQAAQFWSIAVGLTQPIFDGGTLRHRQRAAEATFDQAAAQYRQTVVGAFQNTADVLHALWTDNDTMTSATVAETAAQRSLDIAKRQLSLGDINRLALLTAEATQRQARLTALQARANRYNDVAALFQALGGGWWNENPTQPAGGTRP